MLTAEQEYMLAKRYQEHEDPEAAAQLVSSHLRLVAKIDQLQLEGSSDVQEVRVNRIDELATEFCDGALHQKVVNREHASTRSHRPFVDRHIGSTLFQCACCHKSGHAGTYHSDL